MIFLCSYLVYKASEPNHTCILWAGSPIAEYRYYYSDGRIEKSFFSKYTMIIRDIEYK